MFLKTTPIKLLSQTTIKIPHLLFFLIFLLLLLPYSPPPSSCYYSTTNHHCCSVAVSPHFLSLSYPIRRFEYRNPREFQKLQYRRYRKTCKRIFPMTVKSVLPPLTPETLQCSTWNSEWIRTIVSSIVQTHTVTIVPLGDVEEARTSDPNDQSQKTTSRKCVLTSKENIIKERKCFGVMLELKQTKKTKDSKNRRVKASGTSVKINSM